MIETKTNLKFHRRPKPHTRKEIITQIKQLGLKGVSRLSIDRLLKKVHEKIWEDRKAIGDNIEVHSPKKAYKMYLLPGI